MSAPFASASEPADVRPGTQLGRYEILVGIAQGGMARVWAARQQGQRGFSKIVAIKTILPALTSDPSFEAMFLDEARVAAGVHHPNACQIFDLGEDGGVLYLAMEWVNGESLGRILKPPSKAGADKREPQRLNARIAGRIVADAAAGLHAAHELCDDSGEHLNVVHRDVSPQNILVSLSGNVKVTDFGVAKALGSTHEATAAGQIKGKAAYMSPEQASGAEIDRRSDIFALGIVLYEITSGRRPFHGDNQVATLKLLLEGRFDPPSAIVPGYPRELEAIVMRALSIDPAHRFPSADRMRNALEEWLARSGPVVTETQVGGLVRERVGALVDERHAKIRERSKAPVVNPRASQPTFPPPNDTSGSKISEPSQVSHVGPAGGRLPSGPDLVPMSAPAHSAPAQPIPVQSSPSHPTPSPVAVVPQQLRPLGSQPLSSQPIPAQPIPPQPFSQPPQPTPPPPTAAAQPPSTAMLGVVIGVVAFVLLGLVGAGIWALTRSPEPPKPAATTAVAAPEPAPSPSPAVTTADAAKIELRMVEPKAGVSFELDGKPLTAGQMSIDRPAAGKVLLLKATAEGYQEDVYRIDDATADVLDVMLLKKQDPTAAAPVPQQPLEPTQRPADRKKKPIKPDIPDNPF